MARKKHRTQGTATSVTEVAPRPEALARAVETAVKPTRPDQSFGVRVGTRLLRSVGSLHMAVILLSIAVVVLFLGSWLESKFDAKVSQEFVYRTWWFTVLLFLFAGNIFCAAVKKWPWKKHQTGFLITHLGLLTLLAGGILNSLAGVDAEMELMDSASYEVQNEVKVPQQSRQIMYRDQGMMVVERYKALWQMKEGRPERLKNERVFSRRYDFNPGVLSWGDPSFTAQGSFFLRFLNGMARPVTPSWSETMDDGARLKVTAFYPHASREPYSSVEKGTGFPAVKVLIGPKTLGFQGHWLALDPDEDGSGEASMGPARVELIGLAPDAAIPEFLQPPPPSELGVRGQLVVRLGDARETVDVANGLGKTVMVGKTGWSLHLQKYEPAYGVPHAASPLPINPAVEFVLTSPQGTPVRYRLIARNQTAPARLDPPKEGAAAEPEPVVWYHPPDFRFGQNEERLRGLLQLVQSDSGKLYYRTFTGRTDFQREESGLVDPEQVYTVWKAMGFKFQVAEHLAQAERKVRYVPSHERPALRRDDLFSVLRCRFEGTSVFVQGEEKKQEPLKSEFALATPTTQASSSAERLVVRREMLPADMLAEEYYLIRYTMRVEDLGFEVKLLRAESHVDPGTDRDATYTSFVQLLDPPPGELSTRPPEGAWERWVAWMLGDHPPPPDQPVRKDVMITMNQPLNYRGYKLYQSNFQRLGMDGRGRPVHHSGLTVGRDPGLWLKYLGSTMLALGISCMFYMRAYFFKPKGRTA